MSQTGLDIHLHTPNCIVIFALLHFEHHRYLRIMSKPACRLGALWRLRGICFDEHGRYHWILRPPDTSARCTRCHWTLRLFGGLCFAWMAMDVFASDLMGSVVFGWQWMALVFSLIWMWWGNRAPSICFAIVMRSIDLLIEFDVDSMGWLLYHVFIYLPLRWSLCTAYITFVPLLMRWSAAYPFDDDGSSLLINVMLVSWFVMRNDNCMGGCTIYLYYMHFYSISFHWWYTFIYV